MAMILGVALVLATIATVYTQTAFAAATGSKGGAGGPGDNKGSSSNGVTDGQTAHGLANACTHSAAAEHNPNCGQTPTGAAVSGGSGGSSTPGASG
jgi:hypothetical protein